MCEACYQEYTGGKPVKVTQAMSVAAHMVTEVFASEWGSVGGPLHVIIEDMNVDDVHFEKGLPWLDDTIKKYYPDMPPSGVDLCKRTFLQLKKLTVPERAHVIAKMAEYPWETERRLKAEAESQMT